MTTPIPGIFNDEYAVDVLVDDLAQATEFVSENRIEIEVIPVMASGLPSEKVALELVTDLVVAPGGGAGGIPDSEKEILVPTIYWDGVGTAPGRPEGYERVRWAFPADRNPVEYTETRSGDYWEFVITEEVIL